jgi:hypothetical protein
MPAASWWDRATVESTLTNDRVHLPRRGTSAIIPSIICSKVPASRQCQEPVVDRLPGAVLGGMSRHGLPVRNRQITP